MIAQRPTGPTHARRCVARVALRGARGARPWTAGRSPTVAATLDLMSNFQETIQPSAVFTAPTPPSTPETLCSA
jgi:hypothetical protein